LRVLTGRSRYFGQDGGVAFRDLRKRLTASIEELDAVRLQGRFTGLDLAQINDAPLRVPVRLGGEVKQLRMAPRAGSQTLEVVLSDGSGELIVVFTGRRQLGGLSHGRAVLVEGVAYTEHGRRVMYNPAYTLLPPGGH